MYQSRKSDIDLLDAIRQGNLDVVKQIEPAWYITRARDALGLTPLIIATSHGHVAIVEYLLQYAHLLVGQTAPGGANALIVAVDTRHNSRARCVELLLKHCACDQLRAKVHETGRTALMIAVEHGNAECVRLLLAACSTSSELLGEVLTAKDKQGLTPLMISVIGGELQCMRLLLEAAASAGKEQAQMQLGATDPGTGFTPIMICANLGKSQCMRLLLEAAASAGEGQLQMQLEATDAVGHTPLMISADSAISECMQPLLEAASTVGDKWLQQYLLSKDHQGDTALIISATACNLKCLELQVEASERSGEDGLKALLAASPRTLVSALCRTLYGVSAERTDVECMAYLLQVFARAGHDQLKQQLLATMESNTALMTILDDSGGFAVDRLRMLLEASLQVPREQIEDQLVAHGCQHSETPFVSLMEKLRGPDLRTRSEGLKLLLAAVPSHGVELLRAQLMVRDSYNGTLFMYAASRYHNFGKDNLALLLTASLCLGEAQVKALLMDRDSRGRTAFMSAVDIDEYCLPKLEVLIDTAASFGVAYLEQVVLDADSKGNTALTLAAHCASEAYIDQEDDDDPYADTLQLLVSQLVLSTAAGLGEACLRKLVLHADNEGRTALMLAAANENEKVLRLLLAASSAEEQLQATDNNGYTALVWACDRESVSNIAWSFRARDWEINPCIAALLEHSPTRQNTTLALDVFLTPDLKPTPAQVDRIERLLALGATPPTGNADAMRVLQPIIQDLAQRARVPHQVNEAIVRGVTQLSGSTKRAREA